MGGGLGGGGSGGGVGFGGGHGGCDRRIEVFRKIKKKNLVGGGVRVDVNEELKFFMGRVWGGGSGRGGGSGWM